MMMAMMTMATMDPMMIFIFMSSQNIFLLTLTAEALNCLLPSCRCSARFSRSLSFPSRSRTLARIKVILHFELPDPNLQ